MEPLTSLKSASLQTVTVKYMSFNKLCQYTTANETPWHDPMYNQLLAVVKIIVGLLVVVMSVHSPIEPAWVCTTLSSNCLSCCKTATVTDHPCNKPTTIYSNSPWPSLQQTNNNLQQQSLTIPATNQQQSTATVPDHPCNKPTTIYSNSPWPSLQQTNNNIQITPRTNNNLLSWWGRMKITLGSTQKKRSGKNGDDLDRNKWAWRRMSDCSMSRDEKT